MSVRKEITKEKMPNNSSTDSSARGRRRPSEFLLPDGKKVIVATPDEADALRQKYASLTRKKSDAAPKALDIGTPPPREVSEINLSEKGNGDAINVTDTTRKLARFSSSMDPNGDDDDQDGINGLDGTGTGPDGEHGLEVEIVVHGSPEHQAFLEQSLAHHQARREELRALHGKAFEEWESVAAQLDSVQNQIEHMTDHSATLHANFSKFGYDAKLRTYSDGEDGSGGSDGNGNGGPLSATSSANSSRTDLTLGDKVDYSQRRGGEVIKLFKKPVVKQYFHRGLLWRASGETEVQSFELFFDLLYVGIIAINGDHAAEDANGHELLRFIVTFCMSWKIWSDVAQYISWFDTNDIAQRVEILFLIACLLGLTTNMLQTFSEEHDTYVQLAGYYIAARLFTAAYCVLNACLLPIIKGMMFCQVVTILVGAAFWIASTQMEMPQRLACIFVALFVDLFGSMFTVVVFRYSRTHANKAASRIGKFFEFYPAMNIEHKVERTNAFVTLVLGYSVVGVLYQNQGMGLNAFLGKAVLGLVQAFIFNWLYFEVDGFNIHQHAIRRHVLTATIWQYAHLVFVLAYVLASAALSRLVLNADCNDSPVETLTEMFQERSEPEVGEGHRLYYCIGLGLALASMGVISLTHDHKLPFVCRFPKWLRLANRFSVAAIFLCLSAATSLSSLSLVSITTSLTVWVLFVELYGKSCPEMSFWGSEGECKYSARCSKRQLRALQRSREGSESTASVLEGGSGKNMAVMDMR
jgi:low temperature requirement protein LtrA